MLWTAVGLFVVVLVVLLALKQQKSSTKMDGSLSYQKLPVLFSLAERSFLGVLDLAVGSDFRVFGKVRVADVLAPQGGLSKTERQIALNKIDRKHFDFVLCRSDDLTVLCAIELNDASHQQKHRQERDGLLAAMCRSAGLPLIMFDARHAYAVADISARIAEAIAGPGAQGAGVVPGKPQSSSVKPSLATQEPADGPLCPRCSSAMVRRTAKGGENAGKEFWGCSNFPKCREVLNA